MLIVDQAFRELVDTLEVAEAPPHAKMTATEMVFERPALHRPMPVPRFAALHRGGRGEIAGCDPTVRGNLVEDATQVLLGAFKRLQRVVSPWAPGTAAILEQGPVADPDD